MFRLRGMVYGIWSWMVSTYLQFVTYNINCIRTLLGKTMISVNKNNDYSVYAHRYDVLVLARRCVDVVLQPRGL